MAKLPPACKALLYLLTSKHKWFSKKGLLAKDGSFYYDDEKLAEELELSRSTIKRHRKRLHSEGYIKVISGKFTGVASSYFIHKEGFKMTPSFIDERGSNCSKERFKLFKTGVQNEPPVIENMKENIKESDFFSPSVLREEIKYLKNVGWDIQRIKEHLIVTRGLPEALIDEAMGKKF